MSRIGRMPVAIPDNVDVRVEGNRVSAKGPQGEDSLEVHPLLTVELDNEKKEIRIGRGGETKQERALHGLGRALTANLIRGVSEGFVKKLQVVGVGYSAKEETDSIQLNMGFSHPVNMKIPDGLSVDIESPRGSAVRAVIIIKGVDKQKVGQFAAEIRRVRPPEPYNAKGIRYEGEVIRRKAGKTFVSGAS